MANEFGYSFAPTIEQEQGRRGGGAPSLAAQDPLQVLSYKLPSYGGRGISPLQGQDRAGSSIGQAVLQSVMRTVLGAGQMPGDPGAMGSPGFTGGGQPSPVVHPINPRTPGTVMPQFPDDGNGPPDMDEFMRRFRAGTAGGGISGGQNFAGGPQYGAPQMPQVRYQ